MSFRDRLAERFPIFGKLFGQVTTPPITITILSEPTLSILVDKTQGYVGDTFSFYGQYVDANGVALVGYDVSLYVNGSLYTSVTTDPQGAWAIPWIAQATGVFSFYAEAPLPGA